ncbi:MAG: glycosyltransferase family 2 protein, partial [Archaeoglobaceae archaeon]
MTENVAILIPNYNGLSKLGSILFSSIDSALGIEYPDFDVVVVDNNSRDGSVEAIEDRYGGDITLIKFDKNYGYAGGIAEGLKTLMGFGKRYDYVVPMNNDFIVKNSDSLKEMVKFLKSHEDVGVVQGINLYGDGKTIIDAGFYLDVFLSIIARYNGHRVSEYPDRISYISYASGAFMIVNLKLLKNLPVYPYVLNPRLFGYYDDTELGLLLWTHGVKSVVLPAVVGVHLESKTFGKVSSLTRYLSARNEQFLLKTYWSKGLLRKIRSLVTIRSYLSNLYKALIGQRIYFKGLYDSFSFNSLPTTTRRGPYYPLLIVPSPFSVFVFTS